VNTSLGFFQSWILEAVPEFRPHKELTWHHESTRPGVMQLTRVRTTKHRVLCRRHCIRGGQGRNGALGRWSIVTAPGERPWFTTWTQV